MKNFRRLITPLVVVLTLSVLGVGAYVRITDKGKADSETSDASRDMPDVSASETFTTDVAIPVEAAEAVLDTLVLSVSAAGEAASLRQTALRAQVAGQVRAVRVVENQSLAESAVLIEIDPTEYQLALEDARAQLRRAESQYREITLGDDRNPDARARAERDSAARARSGLDGARVSVSRAELNLNRTRVLAPFSGRIANLKVVVGQYVTAGEELLTIQAMDPIKVEAQVLEGEIGFLQPGRIAQVTFAAFPGQVFQGRITTINPIVEQKTRTARVSITVSNPQGRILPGMYARVNLAARRFPDRVLIPREALLERDRRNVVFVYHEEGSQGRAEWRYVNPGLRNGTHVELLVDGPEDGMVQPGEIVLVGGHYTLIHDATVRVVENATKAEGGRTR